MRRRTHGKRRGDGQCQSSHVTPPVSVPLGAERFDHRNIPRACGACQAFRPQPDMARKARGALEGAGFRHRARSFHPRLSTGQSLSQSAQHNNMKLRGRAATRRHDREGTYMARTRVAVDVGGTFTDICIMDETTGKIRIEKTSSTPDDPMRAVMDGIEVAGIDLSDVSM
ncbi:MAG: hydantoinase/oxoprolinase N-terminal domain-containing protein, partial [Paracoccaceae bacterium]